MTPQKIALLTDSCADLSPQLAAENQVFVVPLRILCKDGEYRDGVDIHAADIYARLRSGELPQTSLPAAQDISDAFDAIAAAGYDGVIALMLSGDSGGDGAQEIGKTTFTDSVGTAPQLAVVTYKVSALNGRYVAVKLRHDAAAEVVCGVTAASSGLYLPAANGWTLAV